MRTTFDGTSSGHSQPEQPFCVVERGPRGCRTRSRKILEFKHYCADPPV
jgi:hypothetical protein